MLELQNLTRRFGGRAAGDGMGRAAVDGVTLAIPDGQMVGIIGRSGAGKSTLLRMVNRLTEPTSGRILHDGTDITALRGKALRDWRTCCAMIFQQFNLIQRLDVLTNVLVGRLNHRPGIWATLNSLLLRFSPEERAMALGALDRFDLAEQALQRADTLSGGQQQRVAIARALVTRPTVLFADEPTGNLDSAAGTEVLALLRDAVDLDGQTTVMVTHDPRAAATADRVVFLADGRIVDDLAGPSEEDVLAAFRAVTLR